MIKQSFWRLIVQGMMMFGTIVTSIIVSRLLGPEGRGIYALITLVAGLTVVFTNLGVGQGILYYLAKKSYSRSEIWTIGIFFAFFWGIIVFVISTILVNFLPNDLFKVGSYRNFLILGLGTVPFQLWRIYLSNYVLAEGKYGLFNFMDILYIYVQVILIALFSFCFRDHIVGVLVSWLIINIALPIFFGLLTKQFIWLKMKNLINIGSTILAYGSRTFIANLMQFFNYRLDAFLVSYFLGPASLGLYSVAVAMAEAVWQISSASSTILYPKVSSLDSNGANILTPRVCRVSLELSIMVSILLAGISPWLIHFLYTDAFNQSVLPLIILLPGIALFSIVRVLYNDLAGRGRPEVGSGITGMGLIMTIGLDFILIPKVGIIGAAIASTVSYSTSALVTLILFRKITNIPIKQLVVPIREDIYFIKDFISQIIITLRLLILRQFAPKQI